MLIPIRLLINTFSRTASIAFFVAPLQTQKVRYFVMEGWFFITRNPDKYLEELQQGLADALLIIISIGKLCKLLAAPFNSESAISTFMGNHRL